MIIIDKITKDRIEIKIFCCLSEVILSIKIVLGVFPVVELECTVLIMSSLCTEDNFNFLNILDGINGISSILKSWYGLKFFLIQNSLKISELS